MLVLLTIVAWVGAGIVVGFLGTRAYYRRCLIAAGRDANGPLCNACPFVSDDQRAEILNGRAAESPPGYPLPVIGGSGPHRPV